MSTLTPSKVCIHTYITSSPNKIFELSKPIERIVRYKHPKFDLAELDKAKKGVDRE